MIQMSVFLSKTIAMECFLDDTRVLLRFNWFQQMVYFIIFFNHIYKYIVDYYKKAELSKVSISNGLFMKTTEMVRAIFDDVETIKAGLPVIEADKINRRERRAFCTWGNLYLALMIVVYLLVLIT